MACVSPLKGYRSREGGWTSSPSLGYVDLPLTVPCGQCIGCRLERARQWAIRCMHESQLHDANCFLTLTYRDEDLPPNGSLRKSDMTDFLKRLRYHIQPTKIRYLQCGEYGETTQRPHHHAVIFGYDFPDKELLKTGEHPLWRSDQLDEIWSHGHCSIGKVTFESAGYVARYTLEKQTGLGAKEYYEERGIIPPYMTMSRRPGIGSDWIEKYKKDVYSRDMIPLLHSKTQCLPPKYYDTQLERLDPQQFAEIKKKRQKQQKDIDMDRLDAKNTIIQSKLRQYSRDC